MDKKFEKTGLLKSMTADDKEMELINQYALETLAKEDVFTFKVVLGDNSLDDRNYEPFNLKALKDLKELYKGKTVIKDHRGATDNQIGRIYDTELVNLGKTLETGEVLHQLVAKIYMVTTDSNKDLIADIKAGIKKEVSTGFSPAKLVCNICGKDQMKEWCAHWPGNTYTDHVCRFTIDGCKDAYETSFVSIPAQPNAGVIKSIKESVPHRGPEIDADYLMLDLRALTHYTENEKEKAYHE